MDLNWSDRLQMETGMKKKKTKEKDNGKWSGEKEKEAEERGWKISRGQGVGVGGETVRVPPRDARHLPTKAKIGFLTHNANYRGNGGSVDIAFFAIASAPSKASNENALYYVDERNELPAGGGGARFINSPSSRSGNVRVITDS